MPWKKGVSGNPGGRPKRKLITEAIDKELRKKGPNGTDSHLDLMVCKLVQLAIAGDVVAQKAIMDRIEGTPIQAVDHGGEVTVTRRYVGVDVDEV